MLLWKRLRTYLQIAIVYLFLILVIAPEWPAFQDERYRLDVLIGQRHFDFLVWEMNALQIKGEAILTSGHSYLDEAARKQLVLDYLELTGQVRALDRQVAALYSDPNVADPDAAARPLQQEADEKRLALARWQPLAESIVQEQVAVVLREEGFGALGQTWPPVQMHMTPLPFILIVSPREEIRQIYNVPLQHGLSIPAQDALETAVYQDLDRSALVVPIGGLGIFPAMVVETGSINFLADVTAHEWAHHWLTLHPMGVSYAASPAMRTINETVASVVGEEIGAKVIARYYPEFVPEPEPEPPPAEVEREPPAFDFYAEMAETRVRTDELLAQGAVEEAEAYMESRRQFFWDNGYRIRKLNQAYFAFYGAYADRPGAAGGDPIGPTILTLRRQSVSLRDFMQRLAPVTSWEALQQLAGETGE